MHSALHTPWNAANRDNPRATGPGHGARTLPPPSHWEGQREGPCGKQREALQNVRNRLSRNTHANNCSMKSSPLSYPLETAICGDRTLRRRRTATGPVESEGWESPGCPPSTLQGGNGCGVFLPWDTNQQCSTGTALRP